VTGLLRGGPARHGIKFVGCYCELLVNYPIRQATVVGQSEHRDASSSASIDVMTPGAISSGSSPSPPRRARGRIVDV
jgi:hypothetical protein